MRGIDQAKYGFATVWLNMLSAIYILDCLIIAQRCFAKGIANSARIVRRIQTHVFLPSEMSEAFLIDLHCHLLPGIDDGAKDIGMSLEMARIFVADGVTHLACTPHITPGVWANSGPQIRADIAKLQSALDAEGIELTLYSGADNHMVPNFVAGLREGRLLTLADSRYVLVEPPHHVAPPRLEDFFFGIRMAGYVPILTHPERLSWIEGQYDTVQRLVAGGVWMQVTASSLTGRFGKRVRALAVRMLSDGLVHILATDAHDPERRPPDLSEGWKVAAEYVGQDEAERLVLHRPFAILKDELIAA